MRIFLRRLPWGLIACVVFLLGISLLTLWKVYPVEPGEGRGFSVLLKHYAFKQALFLAVGGIGVAGILAVPYRWFARAAYPLLAASVVGLLALKFAGRTVNGSQRWIFLGPFSIQPSEFVKLVIVLALARFMMYQKNLASARGLIGPFALAAGPMALILIQPDLGTAMVFYPVLIGMLFVAGARRAHLAAVLALTLLSLPPAYFFLLKPYQRDRLVGFLNPGKASSDVDFQPRQSTTVISSAGVLGAGWDEDDRFYALTVPFYHTDFVFAVIGEQVGLVGTSAMLAAYLLMLALCFRVAWRTREPFGRLVVAGVAIMFGFQTCVNVAMTVGCAPVTGITLPFVSYGGSSLWTSLAGLALILNVAARPVPSLAARDFEDDDGDIPRVRFHITVNDWRKMDEAAGTLREGTAAGRRR